MRLARGRGSAGGWLAALLVLAGPAFGEGRLEPHLLGGRVRYQEMVSIEPVQSDWTAAYGGIGATWCFPLSGPWTARVTGDYWLSDTDKEEWERDGLVVQQNAMDLTGVDLSAEVGYALAVTEHTAVRPFAGFGFRFQQFDRRDFRVFAEDLTDPGSVQEDFDMIYLNAAAEVEHAFTGRFAVYAGGGARYVLGYTADNESFGRIDGEDGYIFSGRAGISLRLAERHQVLAGIRYTFQDLRGNVENKVFLTAEGPVAGRVELPDNELEQLAAELSWRIEL